MYLVFIWVGHDGIWYILGLVIRDLKFVLAIWVGYQFLIWYFLDRLQ